MKKLSSLKMQELRELRQFYAGRQEAIRVRLSEFAAVQPAEYFYELLYCILTPQSSAEHAEQAVSLLEAADFRNHDINPEPILRRKDCYIRFHHTKSRHLLKMKDHFPVIAQKLSESVPASDLREWLVQHVLGLGYKEASHFLRNIGRNDGLTILDRHILRNLKRFGVISTIPKSLSKRNYIEIEQRFSQFAAHIGIAVDELDLVFWSMETGEIRK
ncbi:MAG: DNA lyase [Ignavibacteriae bacterium]|nr:MAG: DNA lyase [Ignavibacteriota bacterium]